RSGWMPRWSAPDVVGVLALPFNFAGEVGTSARVSVKMASGMGHLLRWARPAIAHAHAQAFKLTLGLCGGLVVAFLAGSIQHREPIERHVSAVVGGAAWGVLAGHGKNLQVALCRLWKIPARLRRVGIWLRLNLRSTAEKTVE